MKKIIIFFGVVLLSAAMASADEGGEARHVWAIGSEMYHAKYEEPDFMENEGVMYGLAGSYAYYKEMMLKLEGRFASGSVDYSSVSTGSSDGIDDFAFEGRGLLGREFKKEKCVITPFAGFGYRYLNDDSSGTVTSTGHYGYERESNYFYSPIGIDILGTLKNGWQLGGCIEYDLFWGGKQKSRLGDAVAGLNTVSNDQKDGYGFRTAVRLEKETAKNKWQIETFFRWWDIDDSEISTVTYNNVLVGYGLEPQNKTREIGIRISLLF